jgi:hypothetical protein
MWGVDLSFACRVEWEICSEEQSVMLSHQSSAATNGIELITLHLLVPMVAVIDKFNVLPVVHS